MKIDMAMEKLTPTCFLFKSRTAPSREVCISEILIRVNLGRWVVKSLLQMWAKHVSTEMSPTRESARPSNADWLPALLKFNADTQLFFTEECAEKQSPVLRYTTTLADVVRESECIREHIPLWAYRILFKVLDSILNLD
jgi:hypothetical protein